MIIVKAIKENNVFRPAEDYPEGTVKVIFNGTDYCCYDADDVAEMERNAPVTEDTVEHGE